MALSVETYALCKKYTNETAEQFGALKGAPCTIKSIVKADGRNIVTFEWKNDEGETRQSILYVNDGTPIYEWTSGNHYNYGDLAIYASVFYRCIHENSDVTFDDMKWNEIGSPDGNYDIVQNSSLLPPRFTAADRKMYYSIEDKAFWLWDGTQWELQDTNTLTGPLKATKTVGGVTAGDQYASGTSLEKIIRDVLAPVLYPTFTNPSASISATGAKLLETGSSLNTTMTITFNQGSINPAYGTNGKRAGAATGYAFNGGTVQAGNTFSVTVTSAQLTYQGTVEYAEGTQPKDSSGEDYSTPLPAGSVNSNTITYEFVDAIYANTSSAATMTKQALVSKSAKTKQLELVATTAANPEQIDVPGSWTVTKIEVLNTLSGNWEDATSQFTVTTTTHDDAAGVAVNYNRYTCNLGMALGARSIRVLWS